MFEKPYDRKGPVRQNCARPQDLKLPGDRDPHPDVRRAQLSRVIKQRPDVIAIVPTGNTIVRVVSVLLLETKEEWVGAQRYFSVKTLARIIDDPTGRLLAVAA
ncbi:hypothetical protein E4191_16115 (plasmid) [Paracoccus liaowanqingii]|uniref:Uncharacterized protein n=1 Tax=Paracoccus liaowanqingii TaxID=2560053 RepID=A0A4Y5SSC1_9RHOB|nr:hypothetical protein [Paracoccus liaowanqingii]QDA35696.1 hypothetical protein E4191_16115 [Paracoccus liaowanqingii]